MYTVHDISQSDFSNFPAPLSTKTNKWPLTHKINNIKTFTEFTLLVLGFSWEAYTLRTNES